MEQYKGYFRGILLSISGIVLVGILRLSVDVPTGFLGTVREVVEVFLYLFMISAWGISMRSRVMHRAIRNYLFLMAVFMVLWVFVREIKWHYCMTVDMERILWYCYYIPMTEIPLFGYLAAVRLGDTESRPHHRREVVLFLVSLGLIGMVLTNDFHGKVFCLPNLEDIETYTYGSGYLLVAAWIMTLELLSIILIIKKASAVKGKQRFLPLFFVILLIIYAILYARDSSNTGVGFIELMTMFDWIMIVIWETCVMLGMIPVNKYYRKFFEQATISAQIVDEGGQPYLSAGSATPLEQAVLEKLKDRGSIAHENRFVLQYHPISCGAVVWQEDITEIQKLVAELQANQQELLERNALEEEEARARIRESRISEKNRLYTLLYQEMTQGLEEIRTVADQINSAETVEECRKKLAVLNVLGTYLKRRSNFIILSEGDKKIPPEEFVFCLKETQKNCLLCNLDLTYEISCESAFTRRELLEIYDLFETRVKEMLFLCPKLHFSVMQEEDGFCLNFASADFTQWEFVGKGVDTHV